MDGDAAQENMNWGKTADWWRHHNIARGDRGKNLSRRVVSGFQLSFVSLCFSGEC
jgi:hypothetical protein